MNKDREFEKKVLFSASKIKKSQDGPNTVQIHGRRPAIKQPDFHMFIKEDRKIMNWTEKSYSQCKKQ